MNNSKDHAPVLVFTYGNPSRGDDTLGPAIFNLLEKHKQHTSDLDNVDLLTDFQLQIEHAIDLEHREGVLFVDASASCPDPYEFYKLQQEQDDSYTTHAMSPASVLAVYQQINHREPPPSYMLTIKGVEFDLGKELSEQGNENLKKSFKFVKELLSNSVDDWPGHINRDIP